MTQEQNDIGQCKYALLKLKPGRPNYPEEFFVELIKTNDSFNLDGKVIRGPIEKDFNQLYRFTKSSFDIQYFNSLEALAECFEHFI